MPKARTLTNDFFKTWTPHMAYVLGYFAADGCMVKNARGAHFIEFTSTDRILLEHVQRAIGSNHCISERPTRKAAHRSQYRLQIGSKAWFQDLQRLGFTPHKSTTLQFPNVPDKYLGHFVRGYLMVMGVCILVSLSILTAHI
jgi:hypothetical protein